ncbi:MAG: hypothetical protein ACRD43_00020 [Pyrinomonadaceae bacterium]
MNREQRSITAYCRWENGRGLSRAAAATVFLFGLLMYCAGLLRWMLN